MPAHQALPLYGFAPPNPLSESIPSGESSRPEGRSMNFPHLGGSADQKSIPDAASP